MPKKLDKKWMELWRNGLSPVTIGVSYGPTYDAATASIPWFSEVHIYVGDGREKYNGVLVAHKRFEGTPSSVRSSAQQWAKKQTERIAELLKKEYLMPQKRNSKCIE